MSRYVWTEEKNRPEARTLDVRIVLPEIHQFVTAEMRNSLHRHLLEIPGIASVFTPHRYCLHITIGRAWTWEEVVPRVEAVIEQYQCG